MSDDMDDSGLQYGKTNRDLTALRLSRRLCNGAADHQHDDRANQPSPRFASLSIESLLESWEMPKRSFGYKQCTFE